MQLRLARKEYAELGPGAPCDEVRYKISPEGVWGRETAPDDGVRRHGAAGHAPMRTIWSAREMAGMLAGDTDVTDGGPGAAGGQEGVGGGVAHVERHVAPYMERGISPGGA